MNPKPTLSGEFYDACNVESFQTPPSNKAPTKIYSSQYFLGNEYKLQIRECYGFTDLIGDLGGVSELILTFLAIFICPWSTFSYNLSSLGKLFLARTTDPKLFLSKTKEEKPMCLKHQIPEIYRDTAVDREVQLHHPIRLSAWQTLKLFMATCVTDSFCCLPAGCMKCITNGQIFKMYKEGVERLEEELSIEMVAKELRDTRIYLN